MPTWRAATCWSGLTSIAVLAMQVGLAHAQGPVGWTGDGASALPAIRRVGVPVSGPENISFAGEAGYAYTEPLRAGDGDHHRAPASLAVSARFLSFLSAWLRMDGRYDVHPNDMRGSDDGLQGLPRLGVRAGGAISDSIAIGGELELSVPGGDAPSFPINALCMELRALASFRPMTFLTIATMAGFRLDNSGATVPRPIPYRIGDQSALGASDYHALLLGAGAMLNFAPVEFGGEITLDALLVNGANAPDFGAFPFRAALLGRVYVARGIAVELGFDFLMSPTRPNFGIGLPLVPIEPRFAVHAGLRGTIPFWEPAPVTPPIEPDHIEPHPEPVPEVGVVSGRVLDDEGQPLAGAALVLTPASGEPLQTTSDEQGAYRFERVPVGSATLHAQAEGHDPVDATLEVRAGDNEPRSTQLATSIPRGQLRGLIRSFNGQPLSARVRVEDLNVEVQTNDEGYFEIDVPPGQHVVLIEAAHHRGQRRTVDVPEHGVTMLNADLHRGTGGP